MTTGQIPLTEGPERRYAKALYELASENKAVDAVSKDFSKLKNVFAHEDLQRSLSSPALGSGEKSALLNALIKKAKLNKLTENFIALVGEKGRADLLPNMLRWFDVMVAEANGEVTAFVTSAKALTKAQQKEIMDFAKAKRTDAKSINLVEKVDESMIAGARVVLGSVQYDTTLRGRLQRVKNQLSQ